MNDEVRTEITLSGFDPEGEPIIRVLEDGALYVLFEFMPPSPSYEDEHAAFNEEDFYEEFQRAVGVELIWDDRDRFYIPRPAEHTIESVRDFVSRYGRNT